MWILFQALFLLIGVGLAGAVVAVYPLFSAFIVFVLVFAAILVFSKG